MADEQRLWEDPILIKDDTGEIAVYITCQMLVVTAKGTKVGHIHHHRDLEVPGCEQARVSWTRRR